MITLVAFVVDHDSVAEPPATMVEGAAVKLPIDAGGGGGPLDVRVTLNAKASPGNSPGALALIVLPETVAVNVSWLPLSCINVSVSVDPFTCPLKGFGVGGSSTTVHTPFSRWSFFDPKAVAVPEIALPVCTSVIVRSPLYVTSGGCRHGAQVLVYLPMYVPVSAESGGCELVSDSVNVPDVVGWAGNDKLIDVAVTAPVSEID